MTPSSPTVSVILPSRGAAPHLHAALRTLRWQTLADHETLLVDDGLTPECRRWLGRWRTAYPQLRVLPCAGRGLVDALNTGLAEARAPLIARMDDDDLCHPRRLEWQAGALADLDVEVLGCAVRAFPRGRVTPRWHLYQDWQNSLRTPAEHARDAFVESPLCHPSVLARRQALLDAGGYVDGDFPEDYDLWLRLLGGGARLAKLDRPLLLWRDHGQRLTRSDPRYSALAFRRTKVRHAVAMLGLRTRPLAIWGAGKEGKALGRALAEHALVPRLHVDIDPRKVGGRLGGVPVVAPAAAGERQPWHGLDGVLLLVAVGTPGVRGELRAELARLGLVEGRDFVMFA